MSEGNGNGNTDPAIRLREIAKEHAEVRHEQTLRMLQPNTWSWLQIIGLVFAVPVGSIFALVVCVIFALLFIGFCAVIGVLFIAFVAVIGAVAIPLGTLGSITAILTAPFRSWSIGQAWEEYYKKEKAKALETPEPEPTDDA